MNDAHQKSYLIADKIRFCPAQLSIQLNDEEIILEPKISQLLEFFMEHPNRVLSRYYLLENVWTGSVVEETTVNRSIAKLRKILKDNSDKPAFIETVSKIGYRFIAKVKEIENTRLSIGKTKLLFSALAIICIIVLGKLILKEPDFADLAFETQKREQLTGLPGFESHPFLVENPGLLFFTYRADSQSDLYVKDLTSAQVVNISASNNISEAHPQISPSGERIVYSSTLNGHCNWIIADLDLAKLRIENGKTFAPCNTPFGKRATWSVDGKKIYYISNASAAPTDGIQSSAIFEFVLDTKSAKIVLSDLNIPGGYNDIALSQNGKYLAISKVTKWPASEIVLLDIANAETKILYRSENKLPALGWRNETQLLFTSPPRYDSLTILDIETGNSSQVAMEVGEISSFFARKETLVTAHSNYSTSLLVSEAGSLPIPVTQETQFNDWNPALSPNSAQLAFLSNRKDGTQVWIKNLQTNTLEQVTNWSRNEEFDSTYSIHFLEWSPDETQLLIDTVDGKVLLIEVNNGVTIALEGLKAYSRNPKWSANGKSIVYTSNTSGRLELWEYNIAQDTNTQLTRNEGITGAFISENTLIFTKATSSGIWRKNLDSDQEELIVKNFSPLRWFHWWIHENELYYLKESANDIVVMKFDETQEDKEWLKITVPNTQIRKSIVDWRYRRLIFSELSLHDSAISKHQLFNTK